MNKYPKLVIREGNRSWRDEPVLPATWEARVEVQLEPSFPRLALAT
jgi:hypothetical protein